MAYKKISRSVFNQPTIKVNRSNQLESYRQSFARSEFGRIDTTQNVINTKLNEYKIAQEEEGAKLGKQAEIVYEDATYFDDNGVERTHRIARKYVTPEHLIKTSWAANKFQEEVEQNYLNALVGNANTIIDDEKNLAKTKTNFDMTVAEATAQLDANVSPALEMLKSTVPSTYAAVFDYKVGQLQSSARTELANKQMGKLDQLNQAMAVKEQTDFEEQYLTALITDPERAKELLTIETDRQFRRGQKGSITGYTFEDKISGYTKAGVFGKNFAQFIDTDYSSEQSLAITSENIDGGLLLLNMDAQTVPLRDRDGTIKEISLKDLGLDGDSPEIFAQRKQIYDMLKRHKTMIDKKFTENQENTKINDHILHSSISGNDIYSATTPKTYIEMQKQFDQAGSFFNQKGIAIFVALKKSVDPTFDTTFDDENMFEPQHANILSEYKQFVGGQYGVYSNLQIEPFKSSIQAMSANPEQLSLPNVIRTLESSLFQNVVSNRYTDITGAQRAKTLINNLSLSDKEIETIQDLTFFAKNYGTLSSGGSATEAAEQYQNYLKNKAIVKKQGGLYRENIFGIGIADEQEIKEIGSNYIMKEFSDKNFRTDTTVYASLIQETHEYVMKRAYEYAALGNKLDEDDIELMVVDSVQARINRGDYQVDQYGYEPGGIRDDRDEENKLKLSKWGVGNYFNKEPDYSELRFDAESQSANEELKQIYYDRMVEEKGIYIDKTYTWHQVQNMMLDKLDIKKSKFESFQKEDALIGDTVFLEPVNPNAINGNDILYQMIFMPNPEGKNVRTMIGKDSNPITISRKQILELSKSNDKPENETYNLLFSAYKRKHDITTPWYKKVDNFLFAPSGFETVPYGVRVRPIGGKPNKNGILTNLLTGD